MEPKFKLTKENVLKKPKILIFDIETSLQKVEYLDFVNLRTPKNISYKDVKHPQKIHCIGYKWLGEKKAHVISAHDFKTAFKKDHLDDIKVLKEFSKVLKEADLVVGHNMARYDIKHINSRLTLNRLDPLVMPPVFDTLTLSRRNFYFSSHKLDELARMLRLDVRKSLMCREDWVDCYNGKISAFIKMAKYCKQDIHLTEAVYKAILPYIQKVPNINRILGYTLVKSRLKCPNCAENDNIKYGIKGTTTGRYQYRRCKNCGSVFKGEKA